MKNIKSIFTIAIAVISIITLQSCGGGDLTKNADGFKDIENLLKKEFGEGAYYTNISIVSDKTAGTILNTTVTNQPESLKMGEWNRMKGSWTQASEVTLELTGGEAKDFMFTIGDVSIAKIGELMEDAKKRLKEEKNVNSVLRTAAVYAPNDGDMSTMTYYIEMQPETGGTTFSFNYGLDGTFQSLNY